MDRSENISATLDKILKNKTDIRNSMKMSKRRNNSIMRSKNRSEFSNER